MRFKSFSELLFELPLFKRPIVDGSLPLLGGFMIELDRLKFGFVAMPSPWSICLLLEPRRLLLADGCRIEVLLRKDEMRDPLLPRMAGILAPPMLFMPPSEVSRVTLMSPSPPDALTVSAPIVPVPVRSMARSLIAP